MNLAWWKRVCAVVWAATAIAAPAQTFTSLYSFTGPDGGGPYASLVQGADGSLYGTTEFAGANCTTNQGCGTVFTITLAGTLTTLYSFCQQTNCVDGADSRAALALATNGNFYGTTENNGTHGGGVIFKISPTGTLTTLYSFCRQRGCTDGENPVAGLVQGIDGSFYGTTRYGGAHDSGTIFKASAGKLTTLYSFCSEVNCTDGSSPDGPLVQATNGNFYGTTRGGGIAGCTTGGGCGTIFEITSGGKLTTVYSFCSQENCPDGENPESGLLQAIDGNFYGTTWYGGPGGSGTVFRITATGKLTTLYSFCSMVGCSDGANADAPLVQATDGNFYGTTREGGDADNGTLFEITPQGNLTTLYRFCSQPNCADGYEPQAGLLQGTDGNLYGTTYGGGSGNCSSFAEGCGTIFSLDMGLGPFVTFVQAAGKVGQTGGILGQGFTGTTSVSLNGIPASFTIVSDTYITATVPAGATTGYVTVTTPSGTLTSNVPFHVIK